MNFVFHTNKDLKNGETILINVKILKQYTIKQIVNMISKQKLEIYNLIRIPTHEILIIDISNPCKQF